jgi:ribosomal protein L35
VPKMKTHRGLAKRVKRTRQLGAPTLIAEVEEQRLNAILNQ